MTSFQASRLGHFLAGPFRAFGRDRGLTAQLAWRDILGRYRGANFGLFWSLIGPLMMLAIYAVAFGHILGSRWVRPEGDAANFAIVLFMGYASIQYLLIPLMHYLFFSTDEGSWRDPGYFTYIPSADNYFIFVHSLPVQILTWAVMFLLAFGVTRLRVWLRSMRGPAPAPVT